MNKKVVEMKREAIEARRDIYNAVKRNLNHLFTVNDVIIAKSGDIPVGLLEVDQAYQGDRKHKKINNLVNNWDYRRLDLITVVPHDETCTFEVVDGQGRTMAANILGIHSLPSKVLVDAPSDPVERQKYEAAIFIHQDDQIERLKPVEKHRAMVLNGDMTAVTLNKFLKKYKVEYVNNGGQRSDRVLGSYTEAFEISRVYGADALEFVFSVIENAGWGNETNGWSSIIFRALKNIYAAHDCAGERETISRFFYNELRTTTPELIVAAARNKYYTRDKRMGLTLYLDDMLVDAGISSRTYYVEGDNHVSIVRTSEKCAS